MGMASKLANVYMAGGHLFLSIRVGALASGGLVMV